MAELGNLTACILLRLRRKSTVKIRAGSLFHTPGDRIGPTRAAFHGTGRVFLRPPQASAFLHRMYTGRQGFQLARIGPLGAKSKQENSFEDDGLESDWRKDA